MEDEDTMPKQNDRKRVKDRIIEGIAKAVKHIQSYQLSQLSEDQVAVLKNSDWQFHKLVENLDHAFLYGLRHFTNGYWVIVQEFTHKSTIDDIVKMSNVTTNIGRTETVSEDGMPRFMQPLVRKVRLQLTIGRAWLYLALSDHLLESYILCFMKNAELVRKHYVKEALVLDEQRLQLLLTLSSGLDLIAFELEVDVQYLDLSSHLKARTDSQEEEGDDLSLCSMISSQSQGSSMEESFHSRLTISPLSLISDLFRPLTSKPTASSSFISEETDEEKKLRIETFANTNVVPEVVQSPGVLGDMQEVIVESEVEVVHVKRKRHHSKKKDHRSQKTASAPASDNVSLISVESSASLLSPISSESSGYRSVSEDKQCADEGSNGSCVTGNSSEETVIEGDVLPEIKTSDKQGEQLEEKLSQDERLRRILEGDDQVEKQEVCFNRTIEWKTGTNPSSPKTVDMLSSDKVADMLSAEMTTDVSLSSSTHSLQNSDSREQLNAVNLDVDELSSTDDTLTETVLVTSVEEPSIYDDVPVSLKALPDVVVEHSAETVGDIAVSSVSKSSVSLEVDTPVVEMLDETVSMAVVSTEDKANHEDCSVVEMMLPKTTSFFQTDKSHAADIEVDNNLKVVLMLEIFLHEDENLFKMFQTCQGHTDGEICVTFIVITSHSLYLLKPSCRPNKFIREVAISFKELDYVSISLNHQILHIICHVRHNQFWLTTGDEALTRLIVSHLERAVLLARQNDSSLSPLTVLTDAMAQKISIAKWVSEETGQQRQDVVLLNYTLVHWEDAEAVADEELRVSQHSLEGYLYYKTSTKKGYSYMLFPGASWNQGYFVLEQGILHQYADKRCAGTPLKSISLIPEQCLGCRRCPNADRKHCFEVLLADGSSLELATSSETSLQNWLISLCQATSDSTGTGNPVFGCVTCCTVVTQSHVFMCHEDLQTNFLRTLGSRPLTNLMQIQTDADVMRYCVLVFRQQVKTQNQADKWCLYFNSTVEQQRFLAAIVDAWSKTKQSAPQVLPVNDKMSERCRNGIAKLGQLHGGGVAVGKV